MLYLAGCILGRLENMERKGQVKNQRNASTLDKTETIREKRGLNTF